MEKLSGGTKWAIWGVLNLTFCGLVLVGGAIGGGSFAKLPYFVLLFALCSSPIPFIGRLNGAFAMLGVAMAIYFFSFGLLDTVAMFSPSNAGLTENLLDAGEIVLLVGLVFQIIGFFFGARIATTGGSNGSIKDWPHSLLLPMGMLLWGSGASATLYQSLVLQVDNTNAAVAAGLSKLGVWGTSGLMLIGNYAGPLGIVVLAYWWAVSGKRYGNTVMLAIIAAQFAIGWVVDTKEIAFGAPMVVLLTRFIVLGKVPTRWLVCSVIGVAMMFPIMTAKRVIMTEGMHLTRAQALPRTLEIMWRAIAERDAAKSGKYEQKSQSFLERATDKAALQLLVAHVGQDHPYEMGATLSPLLYTFVPRIIWSDKPGDNSSQTFNRKFHMSEDPDTHISPTHIGELYWNFGFIGTVIGMTVIGGLLGMVFARFDPSTHTSMTRTLVVIVTLYELVVRRGGQIELEYVVWIRTLVLIGILHVALARTLGEKTGAEAAESRAAGTSPKLVQSTRFPNLMR